MNLINQLNEYVNDCPIYLDDDHCYWKEDWLQGKRTLLSDPKDNTTLSSVTKFVQTKFPIGEMTKEQQKYFRMGMLKGICVHQRMETLLKTGMDFGCTHQVKTHDLAFNWLNNWFQDQQCVRPFFENVFSEIPLANDWIVGCVDMVAINERENKVYLIDFKTTSSNNALKEKLQLHLYWELFRSNFDCSEIKQVELVIVNANRKVAYSL